MSRSTRSSGAKASSTARRPRKASIAAKERIVETVVKARSARDGRVPRAPTKARAARKPTGAARFGTAGPPARADWVARPSALRVSGDKWRTLAEAGAYEYRVRPRASGSDGGADGYDWKRYLFTHELGVFSRDAAAGTAPLAIVACKPQVLRMYVSEEGGDRRTVVFETAEWYGGGNTVHAFCGKDLLASEEVGGADRVSVGDDGRTLAYRTEEMPRAIVVHVRARGGDAWTKRTVPYDLGDDRNAAFAARAGGLIVARVPGASSGERTLTIEIFDTPFEGSVPALRRDVRAYPMHPLGSFLGMNEGYVLLSEATNGDRGYTVVRRALGGDETLRSPDISFADSERARLRSDGSVVIGTRLVPLE